MARRAKFTNFVLSMTCIVLVVLFCSTAHGLTTWTVTNLNASGTGSFAACLASSETDGGASRIEFSVGGTILPASRYNVTAGDLTICGSTAPSAITFDFNAATEGFRVTSNNVRFHNIIVRNTATNTDGITLNGNNCVVERCSFYYCRDEAVGITQYYPPYASRGNIVAFSRIENCGSQADPYPDGRGILVTENASATIVGNYLYHNNRGITVNFPSGFADIRNTKVTDSLSPASGSGITIVGPSTQGNVIDCVSSYNALYGYRYKTGAVFYRSGNTGTGNVYGLELVDADCTEVSSPITVADTPFPSWLVGATTPQNATDVGMGTGACQDGIVPPPPPGGGGGGGSATFLSDDGKDGYVKESTETSGVGGAAKATVTYLGDSATKQQYIGVLSFDTSAIPDGATITAATLTIRRLGVSGDPTSLGTITVDIKNGFYGADSALRANDFEAASSATNVATLPYPAANGDSVSGTLSSTGLSNINKTGLTQFKVRFTLDDDNDGTADYLNVYDSGDNPKLEVTWQ